MLKNKKRIFRKILPIIFLYFQFLKCACFLNIRASCRTNDIVLCVLGEYPLNMNGILYIWRPIFSQLYCFPPLFNPSFLRQLQLQPSAKCSKFDPTFTGTVIHKLHLAESLGFLFFRVSEQQICRFRIDKLFKHVPTEIVKSL